MFLHFASVMSSHRTRLAQNDHITPGKSLLHQKKIVEEKSEGFTDFPWDQTSLNLVIWNCESVTSGDSSTPNVYDPVHAETFMLCKHLFTFLAIFQHQAGVMYQPAEIQHPRVKTTLVLSHSKTKARFFTLDPWAEKLAKIDTEAQCWQTVHAPTSTAVQKNNFVCCSRSTHGVGEVHKTETSTFMSLNFLLFDNNHLCLCWHNNHITWQSTTTTTTTTTMVDPPQPFLT